jgi:DNA-binding protein HU-beta
MKKQEFVEVLAKQLDQTIKSTNEVVDAFWECIGKCLKKDDEIVFPYGKFVAKKKPAREGRNPITGATVKVPAKTVPQFRPAKKFKDEFVAGAKPEPKAKAKK